MDAGKLAVEAFGSQRLSLLRVLEEGPLRYTDLTRATAASEAEVSRNLARLVENGLVTRQERAFALTPLGAAALQLVPGLEVLARHEAYFRTHDLRGIPQDLVLRLGDLSEATLLSEPLRVFGAIVDLFDTFEERLHGLCVLGRTDMSAHEVELQHRIRATVVRTKADARMVLSPDDWSTYARTVHDVRGWARVRTGDVPASVLVSERAALLLLPGAGGNVDFNFALAGESPRFRAWCQDLFDRGWASARAVG